MLPEVFLNGEQSRETTPVRQNSTNSRQLKTDLTEILKYHCPTVWTYRHIRKETFVTGKQELMLQTKEVRAAIATGPYHQAQNIFRLSSIYLNRTRGKVNRRTDYAMKFVLNINQKPEKTLAAQEWVSYQKRGRSMNTTNLL
jgi:hypothetical protein